jgi:hypothetical protein
LFLGAHPRPKGFKPAETFAPSELLRGIYRPQYANFACNFGLQGSWAALIVENEDEKRFQ